MLYVSPFVLSHTGEEGWDWGKQLTTQEIHIGTPITKCRELNDAALATQGSDGGYEPDIFDNLIYRYEEPNGMTGWDSPLFTVPFEDEHPPYEAIWDAVIGWEGKARVVKPNMATALVLMFPIFSSVLYSPSPILYYPFPIPYILKI